MMNIKDGMGHKGRGSFKRAVYNSSIKGHWSYILSNLTETLKKKIKILADDGDRMKYTKRFDPAIIMLPLEYQKPTKYHGHPCVQSFLLEIFLHFRLENI